MLTSLNIPAAVPPIPKMMTGPNAGSFLEPTSNSYLFLRIIGWIATPWNSAVTLLSLTLLANSSKNTLVSDEEQTSKMTPSILDLCVTCGDKAFITTGYPSSEDAAAASSGVRATSVFTVGILYASKNRRDSGKLRTLRPSQKACLRIFLRKVGTVSSTESSSGV